MSRLVERMQHFVINVSAANAQPVLGLSQQVDLDASFRLMGIVVWNLGVAVDKGAEGQIAIRLYRPNGQQIQRQLTSSNLIAPGNQYNQSSLLSPNKALVAPIRPGVLYPAGSVINVDVWGLDTGIVSPKGSVIVLVGTNIYQEGNVWNPQYPPKWKARPYLDNLTLQNVAVPGGLPSLSNPFTAQADSDFVWQAGLYTDESGGSLALGSIEAPGVIGFVGTPGVTINLADDNFGIPNQPLTVTVIGTTITVEAATDSIGSLITTVAQGVAAINATPAAATLVTAYQIQAGQLPPIASGVISVPTIMQLIDLGVIVRDPSYKAYSNGYVPAALLFAFLSAQAPGWLYPEIYIPRLGQIYFDFNYLYSGFTPASSPITITLGLKGMKVYPQSS